MRNKTGLLSALSSVGTLFVLLFPSFCEASSWALALERGNQSYERKAYGEAETQYKTALGEVKSSPAPDTRPAIARMKLAKLYETQANELEPSSAASLEKLSRAAQYYREALENYDRIWGPKDPTVIATLNNLIPVLVKLGRQDEVAALVKKYELSVTKRGDTTEYALPELLWNAWVDLPDDYQEYPAPTFAPQAYLLPNHSYVLTVDLSAISYGTNEHGVFTRVIDAPFKKEIARWLETSKGSVDVEVILIPDRNYFFKSLKNSAILKFRLDRLRKLRTDEGIMVEGNPFSVLKKGGDPEFVFGRAAFLLQTAGLQGIGSIGVSFWVNGRPVEETTVQLCIATDATASTLCKQNRSLGFGLKGIDTVRLATENDETKQLPDASLHFFAKDPDDYVIGLFRRNDLPHENIVTWRLQKKANDLYTYLAETQLSIFAAAQKDQFRHHGDELFNLLFPPSDLDEDSKKARAAFEEFAKEHIKDASPASIFVRMVDPKLDPPLLIPLGLMVVNGEFIGFHFRIENPLKTQVYLASSACQSHWVMVLPEGGDDALVKVGEGMGPVVRKWFQAADQPFKSMIKFGEWIKMSGQDPATTVVITSHHDKDKLSFGGTDSIASASIVRRFSSPSIAILNGCGTAKPGAVDFIRRFNANGIDAVIATNTQVEGKMAGQFLECFVAQLEDSQTRNDASFTVSQAYFKTLQCLSQRKPSDVDDPYEERVLVYSLFGNGNLRVCPPKKPS